MQFKRSNNFAFKLDGGCIRCVKVYSLLLLFGFAILAQAEAKKNGYKLDTRSSASTQLEEGMARGSFMVASFCPDCNNGYTMEQISFSGFDKPQSSSTESFFITNGTDREMTGVTLYLEYLTEDGKQLNKEFLKLDCSIPPGETRQLSRKSWDRQHSFYYHLSTPAKRGGEPFRVRFDPIAFYLRH